MSWRMYRRFDKNFSLKDEINTCNLFPTLTLSFQLYYKLSYSNAYCNCYCPLWGSVGFISILMWVTMRRNEFLKKWIQHSSVKWAGTALSPCSHTTYSICCDKLIFPGIHSYDSGMWTNFVMHDRKTSLRTNPQKSLFALISCPFYLHSFFLKNVSVCEAVSELEVTSKLDATLCGEAAHPEAGPEGQLQWVGGFEEQV